MLEAAPASAVLTTLLDISPDRPGLDPALVNAEPRVIVVPLPVVHVDVNVSRGLVKLVKAVQSVTEAVSPEGAVTVYGPLCQVTLH